jgi:[calcium/calmodulin-dependent protein kinase] kinase
VKCITSGRQRANSLGSVLGNRGEVLIADVSVMNVGNKTADAILSHLNSKNMSEEVQSPNSPSGAINEIFGFEVTTTQGSKLRFYTNNAEQQNTWIQTIKKNAHGFTAGITEKMADRELLAGKYSLVRELGRGATGIVYLYTYRGRPYAIKKFTSQKAHKLPNRPRPGMPNKLGARPGMPVAPAADSTGVPNGDSNVSNVPEDVRREIALLKKASHLPNLIRLYDVILDTEHSQYYLVMEFMGGGAIADWDTENKRYVVGGSNGSRTRHMKIVRNYMTNLIIGIKALHANRLCHRDIKPENLLADAERNFCRIADLGVAHYFTEDDGQVHEEEDDDVNVLEASIIEEPSQKSELKTSATKIGMLRSTKGTYSFLPPEALSGGEFCGYKADIWACGVTMYALLYGQLPFYSPNVIELFDLIENNPLEFPVQNDKHQSDQQEDELAKDLIMKILEKDHEKRIGLDEILQHPWLHQGSNTKNIQDQMRALSKAPSVSVEDHELDNAVSVLQSRFVHKSKALHENMPFTHENVPSSTMNVTANIQDYKPRPIEVKDNVLPSWLEPHLDAIAAHLHYDWCRTKFVDGWKQGPERNDKDKIHPALLPMRDLSQEWKERNHTCALETMKCVLALGCQVKYQSKRKIRRLNFTRSISSLEEKMVNVKTATMPLTTDKVILSWEMMMLLDLLAENSHELWAQAYMNNGWSYGKTYCTSAKTHPSLKPFMTLDEKDKNLSRDGIAAVLKSCICLGISISCSRCNEN